MAVCRMWIGFRTIDDEYHPPGIALIEDDTNSTGPYPADYFNYNTSFVLIPTYYTASMRSREYTFDSLSEKRFTRAQVQTNNSAGDAIQIFTNVHDPDTREMILDYTFTGGPDSTLRPRIASRGSCVDIEVKITAGTPSIKTIMVSGITTDRRMISQE